MLSFKEISVQLDESLIDFSSAFFWDLHTSEDYELPKNDNNNTKETGQNSENIKNGKIEFTNKKVGRKPIKGIQIVEKDENVHSKDYKDNIIRKIQVHFHNFLLSSINEIITNYGFDKKFEFIDIDYEYKKNIKKEYFEKLKTKEIRQILCQNISPKFRKLFKTDKEINNKKYLEVIKYDSIKKFLSETYINIFRKYYFVNKRDINDYGLNINLSSKVETYQDFLEEYSEELDYIEKIRKVVEENYLPKKIFTHN